MNFENMLREAIKQTAADYKAGKITVDEIRARQKRLTSLRSRSGHLERFKLNTRAHVARVMRARERIRDAMANGRLAAMDTGYTNDGPIEELGITTWENGEMTTVTYVIPEEVERRTYPSLFGPREIVSRNHMLHLAQVAYDHADVVLFHEAKADLRKLELKTEASFYADTGAMATIWMTDSPSLELLCSQYGINCDYWHNSGNDSRRTMEVGIRIATDEKPPRHNF